MQLRHSATAAAAITAAFMLLPVAGVARPGGARNAGCSASGPARSAAAAHGATVVGAIRVSAGTAGWSLSVPLGQSPGFVQQPFPPARRVTLTFCINARSAASARVVRIEPSGVSVVLRHGAVQLAAPRRAERRRAGRPVRLSGAAVPVRLVLDTGQHRIALQVRGRTQAVTMKRLAAQTGVQIGSVAPARGGTLSMTAVTVSTTPRNPSSTGVTAPAVPAVPSAPSAVPFAPASFWNAPLSAGAPLDPNSPALVTELVRQVNRFKPWMNTYQYSVPVYTVPAGQPTQHVTLDTWGPDLQQQFNAVPIPANAAPAAGTDAHMVVWQPSSDRMWEFWKMVRQPDGWHARWGGEMDSVSTNPGYFNHVGQTRNWGATATGLPLLGGLITFDDLKRGYINHALAISLVETAPSVWSWPAQRTDGGFFTSGITPIPEGKRFRLDPTIDVGSLNLPPIDRMIALAAQKYGIVVRDKAGSVVFYGQDPAPTGTNPWPAAFQNQWPNNVLAALPWSHLEALQDPTSCCWHP